MSKTVLVVAAHADDEALGCGGTIARHVAEGDVVHLILMADGVNSRRSATPESMERRLAAMQMAQSILGIESVEHLGLPDNKMDGIPVLEIVQRLEEVIDRLLPEVIYTHHHGDLNIDHRLTHDAVMTAFRPLPNSQIREVYGFEVLSSTEWSAPWRDPFVPSLFVDITGHLLIKLKALEAYADEMRPAPHSRSLKHAEVLAQHRGYSVGVEAAEAFAVYRIIRKRQEL